MDFYTSLFLGMFVFLIIVLLLFGYYMSLYNKNVTYPPTIADCPDNYILDNSLCVASNISVDSSCNRINFSISPYTNTGTDLKGTDFKRNIGYNSGDCKKKLWAQSCSVAWDGISNNESLCYS